MIRACPPGWTLIKDGEDGFAAQHGHLWVIASWGGGWDHVSCHVEGRCPTWVEMCHVKAAFFDRDEWAIQYHPNERSYINNHPTTLHLWRPQGVQIPTPPREYVW